MSAKPSRILIVDDDESARYVKSRLLRHHGYDVSEASLGRDALALAATEKPDLTLLDIKLPDVSGIEVCREIKSRFPQIVVLQTSAAFTGVTDRTRALDGGADSYLVEPIEPDELIATVHVLLRLREAEQEARRINRDLEQLIDERTHELAEANRRLADEIADRRQAEAALWHTQKLDLIGQQTGGIAHDFNNLLMVISGNLELVQETFDSGASLSPAQRARLRQLLDSAEVAAEHAAKITQQLLAFARRSTFTAETVRVTDCFGGLSAASRRRSNRGRVRLCIGPMALPRRSGPVRGCDTQPRGECARCDARRRQVVCRERERFGRRGDQRGREGRPRWRLCANRCVRHRPGHGARGG
jgi:DNA-binding response OmpR family regulator